MIRTEWGKHLYDIIVFCIVPDRDIRTNISSLFNIWNTVCTLITRLHHKTDGHCKLRAINQIKRPISYSKRYVKLLFRFWVRSIACIVIPSLLFLLRAITLYLSFVDIKNIRIKTALSFLPDNFNFQFKIWHWLQFTTVNFDTRYYQDKHPLFEHWGVLKYSYRLE